MASGNTLLIFNPLHNQPPASAYATLDTRNTQPVLDFDPGSTDEVATFGSLLPRNYAGGGVTVYIIWSATSATSGDVIWQAAFQRQQIGTTNIDSTTFASAQSVTTTTNGTNGILNSSSITFTNGSQMDSLAVGESFRIKITRNSSSASDTMTGDAELLRIEIKES